MCRGIAGIRGCSERPAGTDLMTETNGELLINTSFLFPKEYREKQIQFIKTDENVLVFYDGKRSTRPRPLILPRYLSFTEDFMIGLGIYLGEGSRNRRAKVTNSEPVIINQAIKFFGLLGIEKCDLKAWIQLHERSTKTKEEARVFWLENCGLEEGNITKTTIKKSSGNAPVKEHGVLHVEVNYILAQLLIKGLLSSIPSILSRATEAQVVCFLRGLYAAEGSVGLTKAGVLSQVTYTSTRKDERVLVKCLLEKIGIVSHEDESRFSIRFHGFRNLEISVDVDLFRYHSQRKQKMISGFAKLKQSRIPEFNKEKILATLQNNRLTTTEVQRRVNLSLSNTRKHLEELRKMGKVKAISHRGPVQNQWFLV